MRFFLNLPSHPELFEFSFSLIFALLIVLLNNEFELFPAISQFCFVIQTDEANLRMAFDVLS